MMIRSTAKAVRALGAVAAIGALAAFAGACGGGSTASTPTPATVAATATRPPAVNASEAQQTVGVSLTEWKITRTDGAALGPLKAGDVTFDVRNDGTTPHEFVVLKSAADPASFLIASGGKFDEEAAGENAGETGDIDVGGAKTVTMHLDPGTYVFVCNLPGHYMSGMRGQLIVQ